MHVGQIEMPRQIRQQVAALDIFGCQQNRGRSRMHTWRFSAGNASDDRILNQGVGELQGCTVLSNLDKSLVAGDFKDRVGSGAATHYHFQVLGFDHPPDNSCLFQRVLDRIVEHIEPSEYKVLDRADVCGHTERGIPFSGG